jgi:hypothetical protein
MPGAHLRAPDIPDHRRKKGRLRTREIVRPVRVQNPPVVLNFEEEVLHHISCQIEMPVLQQTQQDEIAVPAIHFVEAATRHHISIRQIQQPRPQWRQVLSQMVDPHRQPPDLNPASGMEGHDFRRLLVIQRQVEHRCRRDLRIPQRRALVHRTPQRHPGIADVGVDRQVRRRSRLQRRSSALRPRGCRSCLLSVGHTCRQHQNQRNRPSFRLHHA